MRSRHRLHDAKPLHDRRRDRRVSSTGDEMIGQTETDEVKSIAERVGGRSAIRGHDVAQTAKAETHGNFTGERAHRPGWNTEDAGLLDVSGMPEAVLFFREFLRSATRSQDDSDLALFFRRHGLRIESGVSDRFRGRRYR